MKATNNLNNTKSAKFGLASKQIESKSIQSKQFREEQNFHILQKVKQDAATREHFAKNKDIRKRKKLREPLDLGELVYVLAERLKNKDATGKIYKGLTEDKPFLDKNQ